MTALAPPEQPSTRTSAVLIRRRPRGVVGRVVPILGLIALWWLVALVAAPLRVVPTPWAVVGAFVDDLSVLPMNVGATLANAGIGYVVGNAVAVLAAILFVQVPWTERVLLRIAVMSFCVPLVAITPILVVVFPGDMPK
ncbi:MULTISPECIES: hypothetical protein [unclassified Rathayibacter]|nr:MULTISPECIES: hypothetical protein [unclassified Rathayibacter]ROP56660.1 hypothetical protein EDF45_0180 [Rathayibacter sp. PhB186]ROS55045.1 hypothetical protein EDF44_0180 [Rathayibacter sp. PhB185]